MSKGRGHKKAWRKSTAGLDVAEAKDARVRESRVADSELVCVREGGARTSRKTRQELHRLRELAKEKSVLSTKHSNLTLSQIGELKTRALAIRRGWEESKAKKLQEDSKETEVTDLWNDETPKNDQKKIEAIDKASRGFCLRELVPAVINPESAVSVNPDQETWEEAILSSAAIETARNLKHVNKLEHADEDEQGTTTTNENLEPDSSAAGINHQPVNSEEDDLSETDGDIEQLKTKTPKPKSKKQRRLAAQRKEIEKQKKNRKSLTTVEEPTEKVTEEVLEQRQRQKELMESAIKEELKKGRNSGLKIGNRRLLEQSKIMINLSEDLERSEGTLRRIAAVSAKDMLLERADSVYRRGLTELPTSMAVNMDGMRAKRIKYLRYQRKGTKIKSPLKEILKKRTRE